MCNLDKAMNFYDQKKEKKKKNKKENENNL